ncbi:MAG: hypothetical protein QOI88_2572 [Gammaproteobacteria bacterium]|jgi:hypothetical protein|nr:hypothetical protein [Gammaproteobacteria bacterium]
MGMRFPLIKAMVASGVLAGCAGGSSIKPAEVLDQRTGMTVGALQNPIELVESAQNAVLVGGKRTSFAYLGPVEWDRSGEISYGLWLHVAPGNDKQVGDIRSEGSVRLNLDDGSVVLSPIDVSIAGVSPYRPIAAWGQTAYFRLDVAMLKRMAASQKLDLNFRAADESLVEFLPSHDTRTTLTQFMHARGITGD